MCGVCQSDDVECNNAKARKICDNVCSLVEVSKENVMNVLVKVLQGTKRNNFQTKEKNSWYPYIVSILTLIHWHSCVTKERNKEYRFCALWVWHGSSYIISF